MPAPDVFIGQEIGSYVVRPDMVLAYARELGRVSDRITSEVIGYTHERRPIIALVATSPDNHARLEELRAQHLPLSDPLANVEPNASMPVVTWMGLGVHGDEINSMDAAMLARVALDAFTRVTSGGPVKFPRGTIVVPVGEGQSLSGEALHALMIRIARNDGVIVHALPTGRTSEGPDLGSNAVSPLIAPKPLIVGGDPVRF